ncbi:palmitoyl-protein thioesterase ABHD10, mitochondrial-like [Cloeon dipterum]|uniref:palmitoyl-protein thioesterase ABHD10, mitochondrial-like n=1 Tax=Cloeon dipterum TaxID=197152 RepID=UPI00321FA6D4
MSRLVMKFAANVCNSPLIKEVPRFNGNILMRPLSSSPADVNFLQVKGDRKIAYQKVEPADASKPTVVFVPGFMSTMEGFKASMLDNLCRSHGLGYVRFDFESVGKSPGTFETVLFEHWLEDLKLVLENLVQNKALLIGSSMGGWMSMKMALDLPKKVAAIIMVAPAINFFKFYYDFFYKAVDDEQKKILDSGKLLVLQKNFGNIFLRREFRDKSIAAHLDLDKPLDIQVPVRILHGVKDPDVPFKQSLKIMSALTSKDVDVIFRKEGGHQMSEPADLELLQKTVLDVVNLLSAKAKL